MLCATGAPAAAGAAARRRDQRGADRSFPAALDVSVFLSAYAPDGRHSADTTTSGMAKQQPAQQAQLPGNLEKHGGGRMEESTASESK